MLFTDAAFVTLDDLLAQDHDCESAANAELITIQNVITRTIAQCGQQLLSEVMTWGGVSGPGISQAHLAAVLNTGLPAAAPRTRLSQVTVTSAYAGIPGPVRLWVLHRILNQLYLELVTRAPSNDRYEARATMYEAMADEAWRVMALQGVPIVSNPLPCPAAAYERQVGSWAATAITGGSAPSTQNVAVAITWTGSGYVSSDNDGNAESALSAVLTRLAAADQQIQVDITGLVPPTSISATTGFGQMAATGWNVYAAPANGSPLRLQNSAPLPLTTKTHTLESPVGTSGVIADDGQVPDSRVFMMKMLGRG